MEIFQVMSLTCGLYTPKRPVSIRVGDLWFIRHERMILKMNLTLATAMTNATGVRHPRLTIVRT
jgi:hypothetical protein